MKSLINVSKEFELAKKAATEAGKIIAKYYGTSLEITRKAQDHPLTKADIEANDIIKKHLWPAFPDYGWLSEEDLDNETRFEKKRLWVVDPLDGTKDFLRQIPQFAVSIALVENEQPVLGVVYNPISKELFAAISGRGATCNNKKITVKKKKPSAKTRLLVSVSEANRGEWDAFEDRFIIDPTGGCAYKMSKIARGDADGTFTLSPKSEWDICAGTLIVREAGGIVTDLSGKAVRFNQPNTLLDGLIYCSSMEVYEEIMEVVKGK